MERSHVALALSIWSIMRGETPSLGKMSAIESMVFVGAVKTTGARTRTRERAFLKIILKGLKLTAETPFLL